MHIKKLELDGWNGITETYSLDEHTLVSGPNGIGKTAVIDALRFAVQGHARSGKQAEAVWRHATSDAHRMAVTVTTDTGISWTRELTREGDSIKKGLTIAGKPVEKFNAAEKTLAGLIGKFSEQWDLGAFHGRSPSEKRNFILGLFGGAQIEDLDGRVELALMADLTGQNTAEAMAQRDFGASMEDLNTSNRVGVTHALRAAADDHTLTAVDDVLTEVRKAIVDDPSASLLAMKDVAGEQKSIHNLAYKEATQASRALSDQVDEVEVSSGHAAEIEADLAAAQEHVVKIREEQATASAAEQLHARLTRELEAIELELRADPATVDIEELEKGEASAKERVLVAREKSKSAHEESDAAAGPVADDEEAFAAASEAERKAADDLAGITAKKRGLAREIEEYTQEAMDLGKSPWSKALELYDAHAFVQAPSGDLITLGDLIREHAKPERRDEALKKCEAATNAIINVELDEQIAAAEVEAARATCEKAREQKTKTRAYAQKMLMAVTPAERNLVAAEAECAKATQALDRARNQAAGLDARMAELQGRKAQLLNQRGEIAHIDTEEIAHRRAAAESKVASIKNKAERHRQAQARQQNLTETLAKAEMEKVRYEVAEAAERAIKAVRETVMAEVVRPLRAAIDPIIIKGWPSKPGTQASGVYCELETVRGTPIFELGVLINGEHRVAYETMSGAQTAAFDMALVTAMVKQRGEGLATVSVELDPLHPDSAYMLMAAVEEGIQVIACTWQENLIVPEDWAVLGLGGKIAAC